MFPTPGPSTRTRLRAPQGTTSTPQNSPSGMTGGTAYPFPGPSHTPANYPLNSASLPFPSFAPNVYQPPGWYYVPNYLGYYPNYFAPAGFMPPMGNPTMPMNAANFGATPNSFDHQLAGSSSRSISIPSSDGTAPFPAPCLPPTQALDELDGQNHAPAAAQQDLVVSPPLQVPEDIQREEGHGDERSDARSDAAPVSPEVPISHGLTENQVPETLPLHWCFDNPDSACPGFGDICLDILSAIADASPSCLSFDQTGHNVPDTIAAGSGAGKGKGKQTDRGNATVFGQSSNANPGGKFKVAKQKTKKAPYTRGYFCRLCSLFGKLHRLSRKDALKRHFRLAHEFFIELLSDENFSNILDPVLDNSAGQEDLGLLLERCIALQVEARQRGEVIAEEDDLTLLHAEFAAAL